MNKSHPLCTSIVARSLDVDKGSSYTSRKWWSSWSI